VFCLTAIARATREQVLEGFRADRSSETPATFADAFNGVASLRSSRRARTGFRSVSRNAQSSAFALLERLTGIRFEESWLVNAHARFDVPSPA
jgi:hypothetical protein